MISLDRHLLCFADKIYKSYAVLKFYVFFCFSIRNRRDILMRIWNQVHQTFYRFNIMNKINENLHSLMRHFFSYYPLLYSACSHCCSEVWPQKHVTTATVLVNIFITKKRRLSIHVRIETLWYVQNYYLLDAYFQRICSMKSWWIYELKRRLLMHKMTQYLISKCSIQKLIYA